MDNPWLSVLGIGHLVFLGVIGLRMMGVLQPLELGAYDLCLRLLPKSPPDDRIVLVGVNETDIKRWGWPVSDKILAKVLERLLALGPRVIGLDLYRDQPVGDGQALLNALLSSNERIVGVMKFGEVNGQGSVDPPPALRDTGRIGFSDIVVDPGGVVRRGLLFVDDGVMIYTAFSLRLALVYLAASGIVPQPDPEHPAYLRLGKVTLRPFESNDGGYIHADARGYQILMDFHGNRDAFLEYTLTDVLEGTIREQAIRDKLVILGMAAESVKDFFYTPLSLDRDADQRMFGIALHAHLTSQLLRAGLEEVPPIRVLSAGWETAWTWFWAMLGSVLSFWVRSAAQFLLWATVGLLVLGLAVFGAMVHRTWVPMVPPALAWLGAAALVTAYVTKLEKTQRTQLMQIFSRYLARDVAESLWRQRAAFLEGGRPRSQRLMATVLFSDVQGFTPISERLDPRALMDWLNEYLETMTQLVAQYDGIVDKFIGDAVMAVFGVPVPRTDEASIKRDAINAVACALAMGGALERLNAGWHARGLPGIGIRVGIYTGPVVAGSLGSHERMEYTVIGDSVNVASRLESLDKFENGALAEHASIRILIGETTEEYVSTHFRTESVGVVRLKGKEETITAYRVLGFRAGISVA